MFLICVFGSHADTWPLLKYLHSKQKTSSGGKEHDVNKKNKSSSTPIQRKKYNTLHVIQIQNTTALISSSVTLKINQSAKLEKKNTLSSDLS